MATAPQERPAGFRPGNPSRVVVNPVTTPVAGWTRITCAVVPTDRMPYKKPSVGRKAQSLMFKAVFSAVPKLLVCSAKSLEGSTSFINVAELGARSTV